MLQNKKTWIIHSGPWKVEIITFLKITFQIKIINNCILIIVPIPRQQTTTQFTIFVNMSPRLFLLCNRFYYACILTCLLSPLIHPLPACPAPNSNNIPLYWCSCRAAEGGCQVRWPVHLTCQRRLSKASSARHKNTRQPHSGVRSLSSKLEHIKMLICYCLHVGVVSVKEKEAELSAQALSQLSGNIAWTRIGLWQENFEDEFLHISWL